MEHEVTDQEWEKLLEQFWKEDLFNNLIHLDGAFLGDILPAAADQTVPDFEISPLELEDTIHSTISQPEPQLCNDNFFNNLIPYHGTSVGDIPLPGDNQYVSDSKLSTLEQEHTHHPANSQLEPSSTTATTSLETVKIVQDCQSEYVSTPRSQAMLIMCPW